MNLDHASIKLHTELTAREKSITVTEYPPIDGVPNRPSVDYLTQYNCNIIELRTLRGNMSQFA